MPKMCFKTSAGMSCSGKPSIAGPPAPALPTTCTNTNAGSYSVAPLRTPPALLLSQEGVMQGCMWGMIPYGIGLMPLAEHLRRLDPSILQPWYTDDFAMEGPSSCVATLFTALCQKGPSIGYFPAPSKSWAICPHVSEPSACKIIKDASLAAKFS
ncbi:hypothetical protein ACHAW6_005203 [Cyclotella cf. meneghiniana]